MHIDPLTSRIEQTNRNTDWPTTQTAWMAESMEWAVSYFGADNFWLFDELGRVLVRLDDWEWVNRNSRTDVANRMGFHGGAVHSRTDIATEPTPV